MSAPVTERTRAATRLPARTRTALIPAQRDAPVVPPRRDPADPRTGVRKAALKAYARRDDRLRRLVAAARPARPEAPAGRAPFVLLLMVLLAAGLVPTLWLSTAAAADSYHLQDARAAARSLSAQSERLHREVAQMASSPVLAQRAAELGMVPVQDSARLVVGPDGSVTVVGLPAAVPPPPPPPSAGPSPSPSTAPSPSPSAVMSPAATTAVPAPGALADAPRPAQPDAAVELSPGRQEGGRAEVPGQPGRPADGGERTGAAADAATAGAAPGDAPEPGTG